MSHDMNWDLASYFPEFNGKEMKDFKAALKVDVAVLLEVASALAGLCEDNLDAWEDIFLRQEDLMVRSGHLGSYIGCLTSVDAHNEDYAREQADLSRLGAEFSKLGVELLRALKDVSDEVFEAFILRDALDGAAYAIGRARRDAQYTMDAGREALTADLAVDGINAWGRIYDTISGKLQFEMAYPDGRKETLPMSQRRSLMEHPDRDTRKAAFDGGNEAWQGVEDIAAAALNAIAGTRHTLNRYRGVDHFLDVACFQSAITQKTLDAMFEAIQSEAEVGQRILKLKAKTMDREALAWYDLGAPLDIPEEEELDWDAAKVMVHTAFDRAYPELGNFVQQMYDQNWIEWEPRGGKRPGAYCTGSRLIRESRIFMTYNNTLGSVRTLAHEAGHAFHSYILKSERPYACGYPMTLAESASTFGEMILTEGILEDPDISDAQKALTLDMEVGHGAIYLMDIPVRYAFEKAFYEKRQDGELSVSEFKDLMTETQQQIFGDVLEDGGEDPYFWASKLHFYITGRTFYNYPYTFGFLLSRGLFAQFKQEGPAFLPRYEAFLRLTGSDTAENVAKQSIDQDLEQPDFWVRAIRSLETPLAQLETLLPQLQGA